MSEKTKHIKHLRLFKIRFFLTHGHRIKEGIDIIKSIIWDDDKKEVNKKL